MTAREMGCFGEEQTAQYLQRRGYTILQRGYRCRYGEIDLIAEREGMVCFVEVKLRSGLSHGLPREFVDARKQEKLRCTAAWYLAQRGEELPARFDVAELTVERRDVPRLRSFHYIENAF